MRKVLKYVFTISTYKKWLGPLIPPTLQKVKVRTAALHIAKGMKRKQRLYDIKTQSWGHVYCTHCVQSCSVWPFNLSFFILTTAMNYNYSK